MNANTYAAVEAIVREFATDRSRLLDIVEQVRDVSWGVLPRKRGRETEKDCLRREIQKRPSDAQRLS